MHCLESKRFTVTAEIKAAPQNFFIPKEKAFLCLFSFGITHFWGAAFISAVTVFDSRQRYQIFNSPDVGINIPSKFVHLRSNEDSFTL